MAAVLFSSLVFLLLSVCSFGALASQDQAKYNAQGYPRPAQPYFGTSPPYYDQTHPNYRTVAYYVAFNDALTEAVTSNATQNMSLIDIQKSVLYMLTTDTPSDEHTRRRLALRGVDTGSFMDGLADGLLASGSSDLVSKLEDALTDGTYGCASSVVDDVNSLYDYFAQGVSESVISVLKQLASTVGSCLNTASDFFPELKVLSAAVGALENLSDLESACMPVINDLGGSSFNSYQVGYDLGVCFVEIANAESRKRSSYLNCGSNDGCNPQCVPLDTDCLTDVPYVVAVIIPSDWNCPAAWYSDGSSCDLKCGAPDPDCTSSADFYSWSTSYTFTYQASSMYSTQILATRLSSSGGNKMTGSESLAVVLGVALVLTLAAFVGLVYYFRYKRQEYEDALNRLAQMNQSDEPSSSSTVPLINSELSAD